MVPLNNILYSYKGKEQMTTAVGHCKELYSNNMSTQYAALAQATDTAYPDYQRAWPSPSLNIEQNPIHSLTNPPTTL